MLGFISYSLYFVLIRLFYLICLVSALAITIAIVIAVVPVVYTVAENPVSC